MTANKHELAKISQSLDGLSRLSNISIDVGLVSRNKISVMGLDGYVFLYRGSNDVMRLYDPDKRATFDIYAERWNHVIRRRIAICQEKGIGFVQFVIPEKSSLLPDKFPFDVVTPTALLEFFEAKMHDLLEGEAAPLFSALALMKADQNRLVLFGKTDSHCTVAGTYLLVRKILSMLLSRNEESISVLLGENIYSAEGRIISGSLALDFFGVPFYEKVPALREDIKKALGAPEVTQRFTPDDGGYTGTTVVFRNKHAPFSKRMVAFGNSFFERGAAPEGLSWWFARLFTEFHFVWSSQMDIQYIERIKPDIVVCQTIERFLHVVPQS